jgi:quercetin dioxygenase-like cupin family protein
VSEANIWTDDWGEQGEDWSGGGGLAKRLVPSGPFLGASVYAFERGNFMIFHFHHGSDELLVVLRGTPTLRTFDGERVLEEGEVVPFPAGREGAHEIRNDTDETVRFVVAGTRVSPEVVEYPDLGQLTAQSRHANQKGDPLFVIHTLEDG